MALLLCGNSIFKILNLVCTLLPHNNSVSDQNEADLIFTVRHYTTQAGIC